jgi:hypothetical protein
MATASDPLGACVITVIDDGERAAITACGSGLAGTAAAAEHMIDTLLAHLPPHARADATAQRLPPPRSSSSGGA